MDNRLKRSVVSLLPPAQGTSLTGQGASVRIWDPATGQEVTRLTGHTNAVRCIAVSRDGRQAVTGGDDRTLRLWDLHSGREIQRWNGHRAEITSVALSDDGQHVVSGGRDQTLRLWDVRGGREVRSFAVPRGLIFGVAFAPGGQSIASGHFDTTIRLWDVESGRELRRFSGHRQMIAAVAVTIEGRVISASHDQTLRVWDPAERLRVVVLSWPHGGRHVAGCVRGWQTHRLRAASTRRSGYGRYRSKTLLCRRFPHAPNFFEQFIHPWIDLLQFRADEGIEVVRSEIRLGHLGEILLGVIQCVMA